jgi:hypothetical protein
MAGQYGRERQLLEQCEALKQEVGSGQGALLNCCEADDKLAARTEAHERLLSQPPLLVSSCVTRVAFLRQVDALHGKLGNLHATDVNSLRSAAAQTALNIPT